MKLVPTSGFASDETDIGFCERLLSNDRGSELFDVGVAEDSGAGSDSGSVFFSWVNPEDFDLAGGEWLVSLSSCRSSSLTQKVRRFNREVYRLPLP